ncbi:transposase, partial [Streptococcus suis]
LLFHFQEMNSKYFFELLEDNLDLVNPTFKTVFKTFLKYKTYITNAMELPYSNAKLEATNKLIKDIKRQAFGFRNFTNFKTKIYIALNIKIRFLKFSKFLKPKAFLLMTLMRLLVASSLAFE